MIALAFLIVLQHRLRIHRTVLTILSFTNQYHFKNTVVFIALHIMINYQLEREESNVFAYSLFSCQTPARKCRICFGDKSLELCIFATFKMKLSKSDQKCPIIEANPGKSEVANVDKWNSRHVSKFISTVSVSFQLRTYSKISKGTINNIIN